MSDGTSIGGVVRTGTVNIKEDGLVSWLWRPKYLVLKEESLAIHKSEVRERSCPTVRRVAGDVAVPLRLSV